MDCHKKKIIKGRVIIALHEVLGRRPTPNEIESYYRFTQVICSVIAPPYTTSKTVTNLTYHVQNSSS